MFEKMFDGCLDGWIEIWLNDWKNNLFVRWSKTKLNDKYECMKKTMDGWINVMIIWLI